MSLASSQSQAVLGFCWVSGCRSRRWIVDVRVAARPGSSTASTSRAGRSAISALGASGAGAQPRRAQRHERGRRAAPVRLPSVGRVALSHGRALRGGAAPLRWLAPCASCFLASSSCGFFVSVGSVAAGAEVAVADDRGRRRRVAAGPVALVGRFAGRRRAGRREAAAGAGVVELEEVAVVVLWDEGVEGREVDVGAVGADPDQAGEA